MPDNPFTKAVVCTDQHFGRSSNSPIANQDNLDFIDWFVEEGKIWGAETVILCGDLFDNRSSIHLNTMDYAIKALDRLGKAFTRVYALAGNHDLYFRNRRDISSMQFTKYFPNFIPIQEPLTIGKGRESVTFLPWLIDDERKTIKSIKSRYVFSHLEISGFLMNAKIEMPYSESGITSDDFGDHDYVFSGHFHFRQAQKNIVYIGNIFPFNFADQDDTDRGMMFLEWGKEPFFKHWPDQPLFRSMKLSALLDKPERLLRQKLTARVTLDIAISYEEAQFIKETYIKQFGLRKMELIHQPREVEDDQDFRGDVVFQSVDQIITDGLLSVQSTELKPETLVQIYKSLPEL